MSLGNRPSKVNTLGKNAFSRDRNFNGKSTMKP